MKKNKTLNTWSNPRLYKAFHIMKCTLIIVFFFNIQGFAKGFVKSKVLSNNYTQQNKIKGIVTDSKGEPVPYATINIKGVNKAVIADAKGNFSILAGENDTLQISCAGFMPIEIAIEGRKELTVILKGSEQVLDQVVVVGYGTQRKKDITGATSTISGAELSKQVVMTPLQAVQGKAAGVQIISSSAPGSTPEIRVRGTGTLLGGTHALYVVDGILTDDITNINTSDIVDMTILKDASATAIYGSRGANGVVIITTKKGVAGTLKINYSNNMGIRQAANLVQMANAAEYDNYYQASTGQIPPASQASTDWYNSILRTAWEQTHNISISGGNEKVLNFFSASYLNDDGIVVKNNFKRITLRSNNEFKISNSAKFGVQASYSNGINQNGFNNLDIDKDGNIGSVYNDAYRAAPILPAIVKGKYGNTSAYQNVGNPLLDLNDNSIKVNTNRIQGNAYLEIKPVKWITFRSSVGLDWYDVGARSYNYKFNSDTSTFLIAGGNQLNSHSGLTIKDTKNFKWVWDNILTFTQRIDKHNFSLMIGTTSEKFQSSYMSGTRLDLPADPSLWYISDGDASTSRNEGGGDAWARNSYLGRLNYNYNDRYLLTATLREDGSSRLPSQNRYKMYPSLGAAWIISKESFMDNQHIFNYLKFRTSWGKVGNDQIPTDAFTTTVSKNLAYPFYGAGSSGVVNGSRITQFKDPNITWEETEEFDGGLEFSFLKSKLTGEINYYNKKVANALIDLPLPGTIYDEDHQILTNAATIQNIGWEVQLTWKDRINKNMTYFIGGNTTFNKNNVSSLNGGTPILGGGIGGSQGFVTYTNVGHPIGSFYVLKVIGVFNTAADVTSYTNKTGKVIQPSAQPGDFKYLDANGDGVIDYNDNQYAGSYQPVAYYGINGGITYKNWDFSFDIYGNAGNQVYNGKRAVRVAGTDNIESALVYNRWTPSNHSQTQPGPNTGNLLASSYFIESGSFIRLNNLTIGYNLPEKLVKRIRLSTARIYAVSQNLFTNKKYSGFTSELPGGPLNSGIELSTYPTTRTFALGVNIGFE